MNAVTQDRSIAKGRGMIGEALAWLRAHGVRTGMELAVNFALPLAAYDYAQPIWGDVGGLLASAAPPIMWSLAEFARHRRVDALSMLVLAGIVLSLLAFLGGGSAKFLQLRENLVSALIGMVFLGSAAIGRPLIYMLAKAGLARKSQAEADEFAAKRDSPMFRRVMMNMTLGWGFGLVASAMLSCILVVTLSIREYLIVSPIVGYGTMGCLGLWTILYRRRAQRRAQLRKPAADTKG
jgi:hypothetical protein